MKALIIDDEAKARNVLSVLLDEHCSAINTQYEAEDLMQGIELIKTHHPDLVFLDIEMPEHNGLELLDYIDKETFNFEIIFTTAYSQHAVQAFKLSAVDYLLKPIQINQLKEAVEKASKSLKKSQLNLRLKELKQSLSEANFRKIGLPNNQGIKFVEFDDIILMEADGMYTQVYTKTEGAILVSKPLKFFITTLSNIKRFYQPHRSFVINLSFLKEYVKKDGGYILMENDITVSIARDKREEFLTIVQSI